MSRIPLHPIASPTDQFTIPGVTPPARGPNGLMQLAQSLQSIEPKLNGIVARLAQADQQNSLAAGEAFVHQQQITSQDQFKKAVTAGKIREGDNPWMFLGAKQTVAKLEADQFNREMFDSYYKSDIQHQDDPGVVQQFAQKFWQDRLGKRDIDQLEVLGPAADQATNALVLHHIQNRSQERVEEAFVSGAMELQNKAQELLTPDALHSGDPKALAPFREFMQQFVADKGRYLTTPRLNQMVMGAARQAALDGKNADIYREVMRGVKTPGGDLSTTKHTDATVDSIHRELVQREVDDMRLEDEMRDRNDRKTVEAFSDLIASRRNNPGADQYVDYTDVPISLDDIEKLDQPERVKDRLRQHYMAIRDTKAHEAELDESTVNRTERAAFKDIQKRVLAVDTKFLNRQIDDPTIKELMDASSDSLLGRDLVEKTIQHHLAESDYDEKKILGKLMSDVLNNDGFVTPEMVSVSGRLTGENAATIANVFHNFKDTQFKQNLQQDADEVYTRTYLKQMNDAAKQSGMDLEKFQTQMVKDQDGFLQGHPSLASAVQVAQRLALEKKQAFEASAVQYISDPSHAGLPLSEKLSSIAELKKMHTATGISDADYQKYLAPPPPAPVQEEETHQSVADAAAAVVQSNLAVESTQPADVNKRISTSIQAQFKVPDNFGPTADIVFSALPQLRTQQNLDGFTERETPDVTRMFGTTKTVSEDINGVYVAPDAGFAPVIARETSATEKVMTPESYAKSFQYRDVLTQSLPQRVSEANKVLTRIAASKGRSLTPNDAMMLKGLKADLTGYSSLLQQLGYNTDYALKTFGNDAWRQVPLFASPEDMVLRAKEVATKFGIPFSPQSPEFQAFHATQQRFITDRDSKENNK
jgi:hypothetical protein